MHASFVDPVFDGRGLELRYENNEVCICGTKEGLRKLSNLILDLVEHPKQDHIHLEDYELITERSLIGTLVICEEKSAEDLSVSQRRAIFSAPNCLLAWLKRLFK